MPRGLLWGTPRSGRLSLRHPCRRRRREPAHVGVLHRVGRGPGGRFPGRALGSAVARRGGRRCHDQAVGGRQRRALPGAGGRRAGGRRRARRPGHGQRGLVLGSRRRGEHRAHLSRRGGHARVRRAASPGVRPSHELLARHLPHRLRADGAVPGQDADVVITAAGRHREARPLRALRRGACRARRPDRGRRRRAARPPGGHVLRRQVGLPDSAADGDRRRCRGHGRRGRS